MPTGDAEVFRRVTRAWAEADEDALRELHTEDVEFWALRSATEGAYHGHEGIHQLMQDNRQSFDVWEPRLDEVTELGDGRVLAIGSLPIRGRGSGVETEVPLAVIGEVRDGRISSFRSYGDREAALQAAGLA